MFTSQAEILGGAVFLGTSPLDPSDLTTLARILALNAVQFAAAAFTRNVQPHSALFQHCIFFRDLVAMNTIQFQDQHM